MVRVLTVTPVTLPRPGTYPGATTFPGPALYPGSGSDLKATPA